MTLELGSEKWGAIDETDGRRVFDRVMQARLELDSFPFSRDAFFDTMKDAIATARAKELARDGRVPSVSCTRCLSSNGSSATKRS